MRILLMILSFLGLLIVVVSPVLNLAGCMDVFAKSFGTSAQQLCIHCIEVGSVLWFITAPFWMGRKKSATEAQPQQL